MHELLTSDVVVWLRVELGLRRSDADAIQKVGGWHGHDASDRQRHCKQ